MSDRLRLLAHAIEAHDSGSLAGQEMIEVSIPASTAATLYEKVRTSIDYQEEHLLRRNAIRRILRRFLGSDVPIEKMAEQLLKELIWAKYLPNKEVPASFKEELVPVFEKYEPLFRATDDFSGSKEEAFYWVLDVMSTEVEYAVTPPFASEAMASYAYEELKQRTSWDPLINITDDEKDLYLYTAVHQALLKSDIATLRFRIMTLYYPDWPGACTSERIKEISTNLETVITAVDRAIHHPVTNKLFYQIRRKAGVFRVMQDIIEDDSTDFIDLLENPEKLDQSVSRLLKKRTKHFRNRLSRKVVRAVVFLFITKMFFALLSELPYDLILHDEIFIGPLLINIFFPPILLAIIGMTVTIPERENVENYKSAIRALAVGTDHELLHIRMKRSTFSAWSKIFNTAYALMFLVTYGVIGAALSQIHFNWLSIALFLFFLSLVTFFGIRIRTTTKDIILSDKSVGVIGTIFDFFVLPLVRAGRWLSEKVSKINVFIYFFDFIIESPFKVAIRFVESMTAFVREKKEEI